MTDRVDLEAAIRQAADPFVLVQRVADEAMSLDKSVEGVAVGFVHDPGWLTFECASGHLKERAGYRLALQGSLSGLALKTGRALCCDDTENDPRVALETCRMFHVASLVCVPLWRGKQAVGVLDVISSRPRAFNERSVATLTRLAEFIGVVIGAAVDLAEVTNTLLSQSWHDAPGAALLHQDDPRTEQRFIANVLNPGALGRLETQSRLDRFLGGRGLTHVFQPVFDITTGDCFAVEALARFSGGAKQSPDVWFAEAHAIGIGVQLEVTSIRRALRAQARLPEGITLCVNAGPEAIVCDEVGELLATCDALRIVMELTEETKVEDYPRLSSALDRLCLLGVRLAIDDTGAGFASFAHILKLAPDIIKLDRELTSGIDHDPVRAALATALVSFAAKLGTEIIAEGIETAAELEVLRNLGIRYGQGFLLCRPTSIDSIPMSLSREVWGARSARASRVLVRE